MISSRPTECSVYIRAVWHADNNLTKEHGGAYSIQSLDAILALPSLICRQCLYPPLSHHLKEFRDGAVYRLYGATS
jgi:hypothetical protein